MQKYDFDFYPLFYIDKIKIYDIMIVNKIYNLIDDKLSIFKEKRGKDLWNGLLYGGMNSA